MKYQAGDVETWRTEDVLLAYERLFGRLARQSKRRIIEAARTSGWDRTWDDPVR
jgi:hypothetical protein